ncbi:restriction endonuclease subunit S [Zobellia sp. B3R18]|uniref:restriction endonuclease subunit S n=1 Tax=Zobellia sp. B3R18 TaxID=2841568 RepID=UPI001C068677|nr:restriction endonuclease subunit S [Zobellia sp. B3R18]MBU2973275.1 restriction endonuclease subunit S [Zobellia sp. B3R18]
MSRVIKISDIAILNKETYKKNELPEFLNYLDTGNLTRNKVEAYQELEVSKDKVPSRAQRKVSEHSILYSTVRPNQEHYGFIENAIDNLIVSTGFTVIDVIDKEVYPKYLYYKLIQNHITEYLHTIGMNSVSAYPSISSKDIGALQFKIPNYSTQKQIAKVLSDLDAKIEVNNKINQELEAMAKTLYDYWFVQFDFPDANGKPYKSSGGKMVYNEALKREIPEGWEDGKLGDLSTRIGDGLHGTPKYVDDSEYSFINGNNLKNGFISIDSETKKVSAEEYERNFKELNSNSILLSINGTLGNLAIYNDEKVMLGKSSAYINCKENYRSYCYEYLNQNHMQKVFWNMATGSTIKNLGLTSIKNLKILKPKVDLILKFEEMTKSIVDKRKNIFNENQKLSELRDWLLPMLMNGQVRIVHSHADGNLGEVEQELGMVAEERVKYDSL